MKKKYIGVIAAILLALFGGGGYLADSVFEMQDSQQVTVLFNDATPSQQEKEIQADNAKDAVQFRNDKLLQQHYEKHGIEMGFASAQDYQEAAAAVVENTSALHKTEKEDGDDVYYLESTNEFVVVSTDGYIRTYFNPDSGIKYYNKQ